MASPENVHTTNQYELIGSYLEICVSKHKYMHISSNNKKGGNAFERKQGIYRRLWGGRKGRENYITI